MLEMGGVSSTKLAASSAAHNAPHWQRHSGAEWQVRGDELSLPVVGLSSVRPCKPCTITTPWHDVRMCEKRHKSFEYGRLADEEHVYAMRRAGLLCRRLAPRYRLVDLFCGAGGMTLGFSERLGHVFKPVWANDANQTAANTYEMNFGTHCSTDDVLTVVQRGRIDEIPRADVVIGGPPCQGFSLLNKQRAGDARRHLWRPFLRVVEHTGAGVFVMENVPQVLGSPEYRQIEQEAGRLGFTLTACNLCAANYGVPQTRWRAFIVGCNFADPRSFFPPKMTHRRPPHIKARPLFAGTQLAQYVKSPSAWMTVRSAFGHLGEPAGTEIRDEAPPKDLHFGRRPTATSLERYKAIPKEGMNRFDLQEARPDLTPDCWKRKKSGSTDLFGRLWWNRPAFTIRTEFFKPEKGRYLHPSEHRPITHREAARLQSFPDDFRFTGKKQEIARQIGNAVPPALAARVADCVLAMLIAKESSSDGSIRS